MASIKKVTEIPGPKSKALLARRSAAVSNGLARATEVVVERGEGALVYDVDGNCLIDLAGGIGMLAVGHCPPTVVEAIKAQADKLIHTCSIVATYEPYVRLCEILNEITPGRFPKKTLLAGSGVEAVENAIKIARIATGRQAVICFEGAYHGRSLLGMTLTSKYSLFKKGFGPFAPEVYRLPLPNPYRAPDGMSADAYVQYAIRQLETAFVAQVDPSAVAAIIIEPVQGEAGFVPVPAPFLAKVRELCSKHGIVMIADEVQSGFGRTGKLFAIEHYGIEPDLVTMAKSIGAGMPIAAVTGRAELMDASHVGGLGGTYCGAPLACVAAIETIAMIRQPAFLSRAAQLGTRLRDIMNGWKEKAPLVGDVRGLGAMMLVELVRDRDTRTPAPDETLAIIKRSSARGLLLIRAGLYANCIRLLPPLNISDAQIDEAMGILGEEIVAQSRLG